jgi:hypothetical protein
VQRKVLTPNDLANLDELAERLLAFGEHYASKSPSLSLGSSPAMIWSGSFLGSPRANRIRLQLPLHECY